MRQLFFYGYGIVIGGLFPAWSFACTSLLVSRAATLDGSTFNTYVADSHELYGDLEIMPTRDNLPGSRRDIYDWDTGKYLGYIPEVPRTYAVVGNLNEHQVIISETTFGGRSELHNPEGLIDYGSLMILALQRARTAKEAIGVMTTLVAEHGYASTGESFSISDPKEAWLLEMIGKGPKHKGSVWVARRVPDGMVTAHANQARIRQFSQQDKDNTLYSKDVISFARDQGYFQGKDADFSFADAYAPLDFEALRFCEARVWNVFRRIAPSQNLSPDYALGKDGAKPLPLFIKPDKKLSLHDVMELMRDHFEGTPLDMTKDLGAGPFGLPYRWRPLTFHVGDAEYFNERAISTQQTGFSFVGQARSALPSVLGGVLWFGVDDTYSTVYVPMYAGIRSVPHAFAKGTGSFTRFSWESAFWVFNVVANLAYGRYSDMIVDIQRVQRHLEGEFLARQNDIEHTALAFYQTSTAQARDYLTDISASLAKQTIDRWRRLGEELLMKYMDGNVRNEYNKPTHPGYNAAWLEQVVKQTGDHLKVQPLASEKAAQETPTPLVTGGYFHSPAELGSFSSLLPADFSFDKEKLVFVPGDIQCAATPVCCTTPMGESQDKVLKVSPPQKTDDCQRPSYLIRLPQQETRPLFETHSR